MTRTVLLVLASLSAGSSFAQARFPTCEIAVTLTLGREYLFGPLSSVWRKELENAARLDAVACAAVQNKSFELVDEIVRLTAELSRKHDELTQLRIENAMLKTRSKPSK